MPGMKRVVSGEQHFTARTSLVYKDLREGMRDWHMSWFKLASRDFESRLIDQLDAYWQRQAGDRRMPSRAEIDLVDLVPLLPYVVLAELENDPFRVRYRLVGTHIVAQSRRDVTGSYLDQLELNADAVDLNAVYRAVAEAGVPAFGVSRMQGLGNGIMGFYFALYPLSNDGMAVTHCIGVEDYRTIEELDTVG
jgi:hypothetical protein